MQALVQPRRSPLLWLALLWVGLAGLLAPHASAQVVSTKGTEFVVGFMENLSNPGANLRRLYFSADQASTVTITAPAIGSTLGVVNVPANGVAAFDLDFTTFSHVGEGLQNIGVVVSATDSISLFALNYTQNISDATVVLPVNNLGTEYYAMTVPGTGPNPLQRLSQVMIVAEQNGTVVEITPTAATQGGRGAGTPFSVTLNRGQTYQIQSAGDLTGTRLRSLSTCARFAVFSGNIWQQVCGQVGIFGGPGGTFLPPPLSDGCGQGNHLVEQMLPLKTWGRTYLVIPHLRRRSDYIRIQAQEPNTQVRINGTLLGTIGAGQFLPYPNDPTGTTLLNQPLVVTADKPIAVAQFSQSQNMDIAGSRVGDPFYIMLSPVEQSLKQVSFAVFGPPTNAANAYVNVVTRTAAVGAFQIQQNGGAFTGPAFTFTPVPGASQYSFARIQLFPSASANFSGTFSLRSDSGLTAQVYMFGDPSLGFSNFEAYGYAVGVSLENLTLQANLSVEPPFCAGLPVTFTGRTTIPTNLWRWEFGDGTVQQGADLDTVVHRYANGGRYKLKLIVERAASCAIDSVVRFIDVNGQNIITTPNTTVCRTTNLPLQAISGALSYTWSPATGLSSTTVQNPVLSNATTTTTYTVVAPWPDGCIFRDTVTVTVVPEVAFAPSAADTIVCQNATVTLRANQAVTWTRRRSGNITALATGVAQVTVTTPVVGIDTIVATSPFCSAQRRLIVRDRARIVNPVSLNQTVCTGTTLAPTAEIATSWLLFTPPSTLTPLASGTTSCPPVTFNQAGTFAILSRSCTRDDTLRVTVFTQPMIFNNDTTICFGTSAPLLTRPAVSYVWSPAAGLSNPGIGNPVASPTATTTYRLTATTAAGCVFRDSITITVTPQLSISQPSTDTLVCQGQSVTFRSNLAATWRRRRGTVTVLASGVNQVSVPFAMLGTDTIEVTNVGCTVRRRVTVRGIASIIAPVGPVVEGCTGQPRTFVSDFPGDWYVRRGAAAPTLVATNTTMPPPILFTTGGTDSVLVRSCGTQRGVRVNVNRTPIITPARDTTFCIDRTVTVRSDIPALFFRLDALGFRQIGTGPLTQVDTLTFLQGNNRIIVRNGVCDDTFRVVGVVQQPLIQVPATNQTVCQGARLSFTSREVGIWYRRRGGVETELARVVDQVQITFNTPGVDTIRLRNCASFYDLVVTVNPRPFITPNRADTTVCQGFAMPARSAVPATWTVTGPSGIVVAGTTATPAPLLFSQPGVHTIITNALGCRDTLVVNVNPVPVLTLVPAQTRNVACAGQANGALGLSFSGALAPYAVLWSTGATTPAITGLVAGTYTATVTDARGCTTVASYLVTQPDTLRITAVAVTNLLCRDQPTGQVSLTVTGGTLPYTTNGVMGTALTGLTFGTLPITVTDANGCTASVTPTLTAPPLLTLSLTPTPENCLQGNGSVVSAAAGGVAPYTYAWDNGRTTPNIGRVAQGPYSLTMTDANGCTRQATASVNRLPPPTVDIMTNPGPPIVLVLPETQVQFVGTTDRGVSYLWQFGDGATSTQLSATHTYTQPDTGITVRLTVTDSAGCTNELTFGPIKIIDQPVLCIPNVFTPNGDGINDRFELDRSCDRQGDVFLKQFTMRVFDRWGRAVYLTSNPRDGWDGTVNGGVAQAGVYFYEITALFVNDVRVSRSGSISLLR